MKTALQTSRLILILICLFGCSPNREPAKKVWFNMGTHASITVPYRDRACLAEYASVAQETMKKLESALSVFDPNSDISRLNKTAGRSSVSISAHTRRVLELAIKYAELSEGRFDPTIAPLVKLWGFNKGTVPAKPLKPRAVRSALRVVGYKRLILSDISDDKRAAGQAKLGKRKMSVDLGGIAKGYAVDVCYRQLSLMNAENVMINLGGNIRCGGGRANRPWKIGVQNPFDNDQIVGHISLSDGMAVSTSGNYERFVTIEGKHYAHIIDPRTGCPVTGMAGVTVISPTAVEADAMSTALFVLGIEESREVLRRVSRCHALFIPDEQPIRVLVTPGFMKYFTPDLALASNIVIITEN